MRRASITALVSLYFLLLLGSGAQGQEYVKPTAPKDPDLMLYNGASKSLIVQIVNLTPYDIEFDNAWSITTQDMGEMIDLYNSSTKKSFMFPPLGIPLQIPAAPDQDFVDPFLSDNITPNPAYDPNWVDTRTHPYFMVFSWDDHAGFVTDSWVKWTIKAVKYCELVNNSCTYKTRNIPFALWMYRPASQPSNNAFSEYLPLLSSSLVAILDTIGVVKDPKNPIAWVDEFVALKELAKVGIEFGKEITSDEQAAWNAENSQANDGPKMYVASYVVPDPTSNCVRGVGPCDPATMAMDADGDAVTSQWSANAAGPCTQTTNPFTGQLIWQCPDLDAAEARVTISVHVLRGSAAVPCQSSTTYTCTLGAEPLVMITLNRTEDWAVTGLAGGASDFALGANPYADRIRLFLLQAGAGRIRELLKKEGRPGRLLLRSLISGLDPAQRMVLVEMIRTMASGRLPTQQERQLVHQLADELKQRLRP